jgi:NADH:ubiquinone oxidoreductase subunit C
VRWSQDCCATDPTLQWIFAANVTGVDWLDRVVTKKGEGEKVVEARKRNRKKHSRRKFPVISKPFITFTRSRRNMGRDYSIAHCRSCSRSAAAFAHSIWRSAEFQEREIFDLYGIASTASRSAAHPDVG